MQTKNLAFVYGTLKKNFIANHYLSNSVYLGQAITTNDYSLYKCFFYPAMILEPSAGGVHGEIYEVNKEDKLQIDEYEGVQFNLYKCLPIKFVKINLLPEYMDIQNKIDANSLSVSAYIYQGSLKDFEKTDFWP
jgi:gamma-glutamylcyclotransferase (GGCT)/AIG2-like uncharacterized protein YtfP